MVCVRYRMEYVNQISLVAPHVLEKIMQKVPTLSIAFVVILKVTIPLNTALFKRQSVDRPCEAKNTRSQ